MHETLVRDFLFADDCALAAHPEEDLQCLGDCFSTAAKAFGLIINIKKTEVLCQAAPGTTQPEPAITIDAAALKNFEDLTYLGSCLSSSGGLDTEISCRLSKSSSAFGRLFTRVWRERGITQATKLAVYRAVVLPTLLYGCQSATKTPSRNLRACDTPVKGWEHLAADRSAWRLATHNGAQAFEER